ncbi:transporter [Domibacillus antri]|uniref:Transporter n=1 Tax=Domibacillus antri TaxID=1714264 RepID=A0A1Q8Q231_9BACI|nr:tripartite tricarboxylate transporter TctB family protein [Domibacillus antri]OLN21377.1 transporter [Domibacillus antri]
MKLPFDYIAGLAFLLIGLFFTVESRKISESAYGSAVGPDIFPFVLGLLLLIFSLRLLYETFKKRGAAVKRGNYHYKKFFIILISAILYVSLLETIGYILSTFLFLLVAFQTMERRGIVKSILVSAAFSFGVYLLFVELLGGVLPRLPLF